MIYDNFLIRPGGQTYKRPDGGDERGVGGGSSSSGGSINQINRDAQSGEEPAANEPQGYDLSKLLEPPSVDYATIKTVLKVIDQITVVYFCLEYLVRFVCSPNKSKFFIKPMNLIDFLAVLPYFISALVESLQDLHILSKAGKVSRLLKSCCSNSYYCS